MSITSDELNFLIYRYLHESGFRHSAFTFGCESMVTKSNINGSKIAPGELVNLVQRGIMYTELERSVGDDGCDRESAPYSLTTSSRESKQQREQQQQQREEEEEEEQQQQRGSERGAGSGRSAQQSGASGGAEAMVIDADGPVGAEDVETTEEEVTTLVGHTSEVFICAWSPRELRLASGSGDATARIWTVPEGPCGPGREYPSPVVLHHVSGDKDKSKDVTTLDWNLDGTMLATGSYDGQARIWSPAGVLLQTLSRHKGPIFSLKWNRTGKYLLSGSVDKTAVVWDTATGTVRQEFAFHKEPTLDVDWRDEDSFASCSTDRMIYVCKVDAPSYLRCFQGHRDEVNAIKWDPSGTLLASCSDDHTAKIWSLKGDSCVQDLGDHQKEIYTLKWSPAGPGSANPSTRLMLATASFDATIRLWDPESGQCLHVLDKHTDPVYSVSFSADGQYLASGSFDRCLHIWSVKDGSLVKTYRGNGGIFEVCWNADGSKVAACFSNHVVSVLDMRM